MWGGSAGVTSRPRSIVVDAGGVTELYGEFLDPSSLTGQRVQFSEAWVASRSNVLNRGVISQRRSRRALGLRGVTATLMRFCVGVGWWRLNRLSGRLPGV